MEAREMNRIKSQAQADILRSVRAHIRNHPTSGYGTPTETVESLRVWGDRKQAEAHAYKNSEV